MRLTLQIRLNVVEILYDEFKIQLSLTGSAYFSNKTIEGVFNGLKGYLCKDCFEIHLPRSSELKRQRNDLKAILGKMYPTRFASAFQTTDKSL